MNFTNPIVFAVEPHHTAFFCPPPGQLSIGFGGRGLCGRKLPAEGALGDIIACGNLAVFGLKKLN